ncbi:hypothetical protein [Corynebacterium mastitidis]|uniref:hypothetical protein n=1 Tax=Corynebacterium mastitidis TaxID=161890 RepID=UPI002551A817|nr:hypothetical protein [Corynebacterium mastitidis]MDK8450974.1 hypothetical protein [Corynebacterium mastitidis]
MTNTNQLQRIIADMKYCHEKMGVLQDQIAILRSITLAAIREAAEIEKNHLGVGAKAAPEHPKYLVTEEDYRGAPEGTVIAAGDGSPLEWREEGWMYGDEEFPIRAITGDPRRVLRWGWEA